MRVCARVADQGGQVRLALPARRLGRSARPRVRGEAHRIAQAAVHRGEPHRRLGHHRHRLRGEERARRLHLRVHLRHPLGAPGAQPEAAVRPDQGLRAGDAGRHGADGDRHRALETLQELRRRAGRGQGEARHGERRQRRQRLARPPCHHRAQPGGRGKARAGALQGRRTALDRRHGRTGRPRHGFDRGDGEPRARRQDARAGPHRRQALAHDARRAHAQGAGHRRGRARVVGDPRPRAHAAADHRQAGRGAEQGDQAAGREQDPHRDSRHGRSRAGTRRRRRNSSPRTWRAGGRWSRTTTSTPNKGTGGRPTPVPPFLSC